MMQTDEIPHPNSRLMTLIAERKVWNTVGNSIDVIEAYCVMICGYTCKKGNRLHEHTGRK